MTVRRRILIASLATIASGLGVLVLAGNLLLGERVEAETSALLRVRIEAQTASVTPSATGVRVRETSDELLDRQSWVLSGDRVVARPSGVTAALDRRAIALGLSGRAAEADGPGELRLRAQPLFAPGSHARVGAVVAGVSTAAVDRLQAEVLVGSLIAATAILLATGLAIQTALGRALNPVSRMTKMAEEWGAGDLDRRFDLGPPRDELMGLAATLDHLLARIAASRRHEQRFADEAAHELRTPLARMQGQAELALGAQGANADHERLIALRRIVSQCQELERTIGALLAAARQELDPTAVEVDVAELLRALDGVELDTPPDLPHAEGDPEVIRRALAPLLDNASRHARSSVRVAVAAADGRVRITVRDDGPGVNAAELESVFEPGFRAGGANGGAGLGLALSRRLARSCGGEVYARPGPGGCFVLELRQLGS